MRERGGRGEGGEQRGRNGGEREGEREREGRKGEKDEREKDVTENLHVHIVISTTQMHNDDMNAFLID